MPSAADPLVFRRIDASLLALRRVVAAPRSIPVAHADHVRIDVSTVLVVDAVARTAQSGRLLRTSAPSVAELAERLNVAPSTASRLVSRAATAGMVTRALDRSDSRRATVMLTGRGRKLQRTAVQFRSRRLADALGSWTAADLAQFDRLLSRFAADTRSLAGPDRDRHRPAEGCTGR